jgi:hypothetical protein
LAVISQRFPGSLLINYYEESGADFCGVTVAKSGFARDYCETLSRYREPFLRQQFPDLDARLEEEGLELDEDLDEFFWDNCEPVEFSDFIRAGQESVIEEMIREVEVATADCLVPA